MALHELAGSPAPHSLLIDVSALVSAYFSQIPDGNNPDQKVCFGTSGHRGSSFATTFNETHIAAITQAICEHRANRGITGPLFMGKDTHALSTPALNTALEVLAANSVDVYIQHDGGYTPTPVISHAILGWNAHHTAQADGIVITPSHNPPCDGGFKYNPPHGGPADSQSTDAIQKRANELVKQGLAAIKRIPHERAAALPCIHKYDFIAPYVHELGSVLDMECIAAQGLNIGVDPMGGAGIAFWEPIAEEYGLTLTVTNKTVDPTFSFMCLDKDGKIRMDCSSPHAMASLIQLKDTFDIAFGNDPDYDRHGIVTRSCGLLNPNHYLAVASHYLFHNRKGWSADASIGKTLVSSSMIDRVAKSMNRTVHEVPVGFKWFVPGLLTGQCAFGGEESAGASFVRKDGTVWTTDKDGIIMDLLAAEITAKTGRDPGELYKELEKEHGQSTYERIDAPATPEQKAAFANLTPAMITAKELANEPIESVLTKAPGNNAPIGGLKVVTKNGWFAARPSGTEAIYKIYGESFKGPEHLKAIQEQAQSIVDSAFSAAGVRD